MENTLPAKSSNNPDPVRIVTRLLEFMLGAYGSRFSDQWRGVDAAIMRGVWERAIADYSREEVTAGVNRCKAMKFPPTLPEFLMLCRPPVNYEAAHAEAVEQMSARDRGRDDWSRPAIYWAAARMGNEIKALPYSAIKYRWQRALDAATRDCERGVLGDVPPRVLALPHEHVATPMPPDIKAKFASLVQQMTNPSRKESDDAGAV